MAGLLHLVAEVQAAARLAGVVARLAVAVVSAGLAVAEVVEWYCREEKLEQTCARYPIPLFLV